MVSVAVAVEETFIDLLLMNWLKSDVEVEV